jgi:hypothetical protein
MVRLSGSQQKHAIGSTKALLVRLTQVERPISITYQSTWQDTYMGHYNSQIVQGASQQAAVSFAYGDTGFNSS